MTQKRHSGPLGLSGPLVSGPLVWSLVRIETFWLKSRICFCAKTPGHLDFRGVTRIFGDHFRLRELRLLRLLLLSSQQPRFTWVDEGENYYAQLVKPA